MVEVVWTASAIQDLNDIAEYIQKTLFVMLKLQQMSYFLPPIYLKHTQNREQKSLNSEMNQSDS